MKVPLSFLGTVQYRAAVVHDEGDGSTVAVSSRSHQRTDSLALDLRAGGGFVARFSK